MTPIMGKIAGTRANSKRESLDKILDAAARLGLRDRAAARMIDDVTEAAHGWIDRCAQIGFTPRQTDLLAELLRARTTSLQRPAL